MRYEGKEVTRKDSIKKHAGHIKNNKVCFATSDGNAFNGEKAKTAAHNHATKYRPSLEVFDLSGEVEVVTEKKTEKVTEKKPTAKPKAKKKK